MRKLVLFSLLGLSSLLFISSKQFTEAENTTIYGYWWSPEKESKIKIYKATSGKVCGKLSWIKEPNNDDGSAKKDVNNPDEDKRDTPLLNLVLLKNFNYEGDNKWEDGTIYDPRNGKNYSCPMTLSSDGNTLDIRGYVGFSFIGRTSQFTKVK